MSKPIDAEWYQFLKERAEGKRPNVPWRQHETARQRAERWNAANPQDPIAVPDDDETSRG